MFGISEQKGFDNPMIWRNNKLDCPKRAKMFDYQKQYKHRKNKQRNAGKRVGIYNPVVVK
jgi:hypothetical protein